MQVLSDPWGLVVCSKLAEIKSALGQIDKSALPISTVRHVRDKEHLRYVAQQPCLICGRSPVMPITCALPSAVL